MIPVKNLSHSLAEIIKFGFGSTRIVPSMQIERMKSSTNQCLFIPKAQNRLFQFSTCKVEVPKPQNPHQNVIKSSYEGDGFYVEQMLVGCLAIYSYYIESNGEAFIIDPQNDITNYVELIQKRKSKLKGVFMTHYHADYVAGHMELRNKYGCNIFMGPKALEERGIQSLKDGEILRLGSVELELLHTPGHTEESSCLVVNNKSGKDEVVFTGDTVFLNEVGRPDLAVKTDLSAEDLAKLLYDSIQKIKKLDGNVRIYPGHGSGSSCGKAIGSGDFCDVQTQKKNNYALISEDKDSFVKQVLQNMPKAPAYFSYNATMNKFDEFSYEKAFEQANKKLNIEEFDRLRFQAGVKILDLRDIPELVNGIIENSICIAFNGSFASWAGQILSPKDNIVLFGNPEITGEAIKRLLRIGYTNISGFNDFTIQEWKGKQLSHYIPEFAESVFDKERTALDVRKPSEWETGVADTENLVALELSELYNTLDKSKKYITYCRGGYRSRIAYSILKGHGFDVKAFPYPLNKIEKMRKFEQ